MQDVDPSLIEVFVDGKEDGLPDAGRLDELGLGSGSVVFMLHRLGWRWEECGSGIALSGDGLVATKTVCDYKYQLVTGGSPMTEGRHYWEVELTAGLNFMVGAVRPGLDHDLDHCTTNGAYFITNLAGSAALYRKGTSWEKYDADNGEKYDAVSEGDLIGVQLDLDAGWMRFFRNGKLCGLDFPEGVKGPLVRAVQVASLYRSDKITVQQGTDKITVQKGPLVGDKITVQQGTVAPPEGAVLQGTVAPPEWIESGHEWIGRRIKRVFGPTGSTAMGRIVSWAQADRLWHVVHGDGEEEDLEEHEVEEGLQPI
jgi:hypothetical protein